MECVCSLNMDLNLVPLKLVLDGVVTIEVHLLFIDFTKELYRKQIWGYTTPTISKPLIRSIKEEEDESPPQFSNPVDKKVQ
jgi:hypothetical protein